MKKWILITVGISILLGLLAYFLFSPSKEEIKSREYKNKVKDYEKIETELINFKQ